MRSKFLVLCACLLAIPSLARAQDASEAWEKAWNAGDIAGVAAVYAEDAVLLPPNTDAVEGRAAIQAYWQEAYDASPGSQVDLETVEHEVFDGVAVERGTYVTTGADGAHLDHGKFVAIWANRDGEWVIVRDIFNSNMAP